MTKSSKKTGTRRLRSPIRVNLNPPPQPTLNPAEHGLTGAEFAVYQIVEKRQAAGKTTTSGDVAKAWKGKNRSYTYRVLKSLMDKALLEQYSQRYYRLAKRKEETHVD